MDDVAAVRNQCIEKLLHIGRPEPYVQEWAKIDRTLTVWNKILHNSLPTREEFERWEKLPKTLESLQQIRYPILSGWSMNEIIGGLTPFIVTHVRKFHTNRCPYEDCFQNAVVGVLQALKTDAGIASFAHHAFLHMKTQVRRNSANSGIISRPEKTPSKTEVLREITEWLGGWWLDCEARRWATKHKVTFREDEDSSWLKRAYEEVEKSLTKTQEVTINSSPPNFECFISPSDCEDVPIQKIGQKGITERLIKETFSLARLSRANLCALFAWLEYRFHKPGLFGQLDFERYRTVADLIHTIAVSPEFHDNILTLDAPIDEEFTAEQVIPDQNSRSPLEEAETKDQQAFQKAILQEIYKRLKLTLEQETVLVYIFGLNGEQSVTGSVLAREFGKYVQLLASKKNLKVTLDATKQITRQRITEYIHHLVAQIRATLYKYFFVEKGKSEYEVARRLDLPSCDQAVAMAHFNPRLPQSIEQIASNYSLITGLKQQQVVALESGDMQKLVKEQLGRVKVRMVQACLT
jgi:hypothetical protein